MPRVDPLEDITIAPPPGSEAAARLGVADTRAAARAAATRLRRDTLKAAREFVTLDMLATSAVNRLSLTEVDVHLGRHKLEDPDRELGETDARKILVYCDALRVQRGLQPFAVREVETQPYTVAKPAPVASRLPLSPSGEWRVLETHRKVSMPGGLYVLHLGTILKASETTEAVLESIAAQGVKLEAHPPIARESCPTCGTTWLPVVFEHGCPVCKVREVIGRFEVKLEEVREHSREARRADEAEHGQALAEVAGKLAAASDQLGALSRWAVDMGARPPGADGTWQGEPHPPPLEVVTEERGRVRAYEALVAGGMSDAEARGAIWPEPPAPPATSPTPSVPAPAVVQADEPAARTTTSRSRAGR